MVEGSAASIVAGGNSGNDADERLGGRRKAEDEAMKKA